MQQKKPANDNHQPRPTVYYLSDPRDYSRGYVGSTFQTVQARVSNEKSAARRPGPISKYAVSVWLRELESLGLEPEIEILQTLNPNVGDQRLRSTESWWIEHYLDRGCTLMNRRFGNGRFFDEVKERLRAPKQPPTRRAVVDDRDHVFATVADAARQNGGSPQNISRNLRNPRMAHRKICGRSYRYLDQVVARNDNGQLAGITHGGPESFKAVR